jgi:glycosyltransferase involved in cell wall biosynthesis
LVDIIILSSNSVIYDIRIRKIVKSLQKKYSVSILGWNREKLCSEKIHNFIVKPILFSLKAPYGKPTLILYYPVFWTWLVLRLFKYKPRMVHSCDFDTLIPGLIYKMIFRKRLVFDVFDRYSGYVPLNFKKLQSVLNWFEEFLSTKADVMVTVTDKVLSTFRMKPTRCAIIMNYSEDNPSISSKREGNIKENSNDKKKNNDVFRLVYTGAVQKNYGLERIIAAIDGLDNVELAIAGRIIDNEFLDQILQLPNIKYHGLLQHSDALALEGNSDVLMVLYDLKYSVADLSSPNKIFEGMMCGLPIITNMETKLVNEVGCGIIVDYDDINQIKAAVIRLRDNIELRRTLGNNGRRAFLQKYNWTIMEEQLHRIYENLLTVSK